MKGVCGAEGTASDSTSVRVIYFRGGDNNLQMHVESFPWVCPHEKVPIHKVDTDMADKLQKHLCTNVYYKLPMTAIILTLISIDTLISSR